MELAVKTRRRKVIDIPEDVFRYLSIKAVAQGTDMQDSEVYGWLVKNEPDGLVAVDEKEQAVFEQKLGLKQK